MSAFKDKLKKADEVYKDMTLLVDICKSSNGDFNPWNVYWDSFWEINKEFPFNVEWYDPDTSYEEDIMQRYNAIEEFVSSFEGRLDEDLKCYQKSTD